MLACAAHRVSAVEGVWLIPDFVSSEEEAQLWAAATGPAARWTQLSGRAVQALGGVVHDKAGLLPAPLPRWLSALLARLECQSGLFSEQTPLNHVLLNSYSPGQGILPHQDGPLYSPAVAIVSLGAHAVMSFSPHASCPEAQGASVWLPRRSLLLFSGVAYQNYMHGVNAVCQDDTASVCNTPPGLQGVVPREGRRISLTCRNVVKVRSGLLGGR